MPPARPGKALDKVDENPVGGLQEYQSKLIANALSVGVLKFGSSFVQKSGRVSPYYFHIGEMCTGKLINDLAMACANFIAGSLAASTLPPFDIIFGLAYKGIPLAATVSLLLWRDHSIDVAWAYNRKEAKDHGEGGVFVGAPVSDRRILILDDVITAGTTIRIALGNITAAGGKVIAVVECLDREEVGDNIDGHSPRVSAMEEISEEINGPVRAMIGMRNVMTWLRAQGRREELLIMEAYWNKYGIGEDMVSSATTS